MKVELNDFADGRPIEVSEIVYDPRFETMRDATEYYNMSLNYTKKSIDDDVFNQRAKYCTKKNKQTY